MQKIFLIRFEGDTKEVNDFIGDNGIIISVNPQNVGAEGPNKGNFLIVADNGK